MTTPNNTGAETALRFRKKPVAISAMHFDGTVQTASVIARWANAGDALDDDPTITYIVNGAEPGRAFDMVVQTLAGGMSASVGDWIIQGVKGEFYACKPDVFALTYEPASPPEAAPAVDGGDAVLLDATLRDLLDAAKELRDLMQGVIDGDYKPDSFTLQPIDHAISEAEETLAATPAPAVDGGDALLRSTLASIARMSGPAADLARATLKRAAAPAPAAINPAATDSKTIGAPAVEREAVAWGCADRNGRLWLCDFGLATIRKNDAENYARWATEHKPDGPFTVVPFARLDTPPATPREPVGDAVQAMLQHWMGRYNGLIYVNRSFSAEEVLRCINDVKRLTAAPAPAVREALYTAEQLVNVVLDAEERAAGTLPATPAKPAEDAGCECDPAQGFVCDGCEDEPDAAAEGKQEAGDYMRGWEDANAGRAPRTPPHDTGTERGERAHWLAAAGGLQRFVDMMSRDADKPDVLDGWKAACSWHATRLQTIVDDMRANASLFTHKGMQASEGADSFVAGYFAGARFYAPSWTTDAHLLGAALIAARKAPKGDRA